MQSGGGSGLRLPPRGSAGCVCVAAARSRPAVQQRGAPCVQQPSSPAGLLCAPALLGNFHGLATGTTHPPKHTNNPPLPAGRPAGGSTRATACGAALGGSTPSWRGQCRHTPKLMACQTTRSMWWRRGWPADQLSSRRGGGLAGVLAPAAAALPGAGSSLPGSQAKQCVAGQKVSRRRLHVKQPSSALKN